MSLLVRADPNIGDLVAQALPAGSFAEYRPMLRWLMWIEQWFPRVFAASLIALLLRFAFVNHGCAERTFGRLSRQAGSVAGTLLLGIVLMFLLSQVTWGVMLRSRPVRADATQQGAPTAGRLQPGK
jgi:hypothetical protein